MPNRNDPNAIILSQPELKLNSGEFHSSHLLNAQGTASESHIAEP
jgi:hypothetical protein